MDIAAAVGAERLREIMAELVTLRGGGSALRRHGRQFYRRRDHGGVRCAGCVGRPRSPRLSCGAGHARRGERLAEEVKRRDGMELGLRVGLNSGEVIAGEIGSGPFGYTAVGEQVGMAQQMDRSLHPAGSCSTSRQRDWPDVPPLLGDPEMVTHQGRRCALCSRCRLLGVAADHDKGRAGAVDSGRARAGSAHHGWTSGPRD